jgi:hypothetical protein
MAGELIIKNGINVSGSIIAQSITGSFTGSFNGTSTSSSFATTSSIATSASFASTASYVATASYTPTLAQVTTAGNTTTNAITVGDITSTGVIKSVISSVTAQFTAVNPASSYPRAHFQIGQSTSDNNVGLVIAPFYSSAGVQKPAFVQVSTNKNTQDSGQFSGYFLINTSTFTIGTNKRDATTSGGVPIIFAPAITEAMRIQNNGNIQIGTTTDAGYRLDINGTGRFSGNVQITGSATNSLLVKGSGTTSATTTLRVENANASASLVVLDNTNVGIGTSNPSARLEVAGVTTGTAFKVSGGFTGFTGQYFYINEYGSAAMVGTTTDPNNLLFGALGTSDTFARLAFGFLYDKPYLGFGPGGGATRDIYLYRDNADLILGTGTGNTERLRVKASGNLLIGTATDPGYKLNVSGSGNFTNNLTVTGSLQVTGGITGSLLGTGSYATQALSSSFAVSASRAVSASYAPSIPAFPYTGSAEVTGSLSVVGTTTVSGSIIVQDGSMGIVSTGTTNATEAFKVQNATPEVLFNVKDDGELLINTTKYTSNGVLTNNAGIITEVIGYNGIITIDQSPNPPIQIQVTNGIITNVL